jgi:hypothetical protein
MRPWSMSDPLSRKFHINGTSVGRKLILQNREFKDSNKRSRKEVPVSADFSPHVPELGCAFSDRVELRTGN